LLHSLVSRALTTITTTTTHHHTVNMRRKPDGRGGGAKHGKKKPSTPSLKASKPGKPGPSKGGNLVAAPSSSSSGIPGRGAPMRAKNLTMDDKSKSLILDLLHTLRAQEREDFEATAPPSTSSSSSSSSAAITAEPGSVSSRRGARDVSLEELERALLEAKEGEEEDDGEDLEEEEELGQDGSFAEMANMLAGTKFNEDEDEDESGSDDEEDDDDSSDDDEEENSEEEEDEEEEEKQQQQKKPLSKQDQDMLLKSLIKEERESYVAQQLAAAASAAKEGAAAAAAASKSSKGKGKEKDNWKGDTKNKVRVTLCNGKGVRKLVVVERRKDLQGFFAVAKAKLKMKPKSAVLKETGEALENTLLLENDAVVVVSDEGCPPPAAAGSTAAATAETSQERRERHLADRTAEQKEAQRVRQAEAALDVVKEAYRKRNKEGLDGGEQQQQQQQQRVMTEKERSRENERLAAKLMEKEGSEEYKKSMYKQRAGLPAFAQRKAILAAIDKHQVVVVEGETGSGKTTQVPQFILDEWTAQGKGSECNILCTQPRRISAIGVAERVAAERMEGGVGKSVGYSIRLESRRSAATRLLFCTTGILLRRLASDKDLEGVSHILVDEVHERTLDSDFLLIILKDLLVRRRDLKVVLMSATVEASLFSNYFGGAAVCPCLHIPGRTFPVEHLFLEDVGNLLAGKPMGTKGKGGGPPRPSHGGRGGGAGRGPPRGRGGGRGGGGGRGEGGGGGYGEEEEGDGNDDDADKDLREFFGRETAQSLKALSSPPADRVPIDYELIARLTRFLVERHRANEKKDGGGAILIFLPGMAEIERAIQTMKRDSLLRDDKRASIFALHSSIPTGAQRSVFKKMDLGVCKIVVATNIAETSITVSDVTHVIDAGREKQMAYDPHTHMTSLREVWVSQASAQQRAGRAGRVRPGTCYRLYEQAFLEHEMPSHTLPEIRRVTLEDLILTVLLLELGSPQAFLQRAIEPPSSKAVAASLKVLLDIEAVAFGPKDENGGKSVLLKPLGFHLASLPVDCRVGKMLVIASLFDCLDPILTIAAAFSGKSPFYAPVGKREEAQLAKQRFADSKSDHLALVALWKAWSHVKDGPYSTRKAFCMENFVSMSALENMEAVRNQLMDNLVKCGFAVPTPTTSSSSSYSSSSFNKRSGPASAAAAAAAAAVPAAAINYNANEYDERLLKCVLLSGLTPQIAKLVRPTRGKGAHFVTKDPTVNVAIHPSSVNAKRIQQAGPEGREALAIYHCKMQTSRTYLHDVSFVSPLSLLLFGSNVRVSREHGGVASKVVNIVVDDWLAFKSKEETSVLLTVFKKQLDACLLLKITRPDSDLVFRFHPLVKTLRQLLMIEVTGVA